MTAVITAGQKAQLQNQNKYKFKISAKTLWHSAYCDILNICTSPLALYSSIFLKGCKWHSTNNRFVEGMLSVPDIIVVL